MKEIIHGRRPAAFFLIKTDLDARKVLGSVKKNDLVVWANNVFGPYQVVAYVEADSRKELIECAEELRSRRFITDLDFRIVKGLPKDKDLNESFKITKKESAVLLVNVNYKEEKERIVTYNLRKIKGVKWVRAMWGPTDIIAIVEAEGPEAMRDLICDDVKVSKGVSSNSTLFCYPN